MDAIYANTLPNVIKDMIFHVQSRCRQMVAKGVTGGCSVVEPDCATRISHYVLVRPHHFPLISGQSLRDKCIWWANIKVEN